MKNLVILALGLSVTLVGCGNSKGSGGGYTTNGSAASTAPASTTQQNNNRGLQNVPVTNNNNQNTQPQPSPSPAAPAAPTISGITPNSGGAGVLVTITGANFANLTDVQIGGVSLTNVTYAPTEIQGTTGQGPAGAADVVVFSSNGNATLPGAFTYNTAPPPPPAGPKWADISAIINNGTCLNCHGPGAQFPDLTSYSATSGDGQRLVAKTSSGGSMRRYLANATTDAPTIQTWVNNGCPQ